MKTVCLYFQVHQPWRLRRYRFFNMGKEHHYLDDLLNRSIMQKVARECYLPMNALLLKIIGENKGKFRCSFSITAIAVEQMRAYAPEVLDSFRRLAETGCVEFLAETYSHSLASLASEEDFAEQVRLHSAMIEREFGQKPAAFRNTELIYSDRIGAMVARMGFRTMLAEGARHVLGWKSPEFVYTNAIDQRLRLLLRNYKLSDDIAFRFSNRSWDQWPLTADKYVEWLSSERTPGEVVNLFMDYETFGEHQTADTGIFEFVKALPKLALQKKNGLEFATVSEAARKHQPVAVLHCPHAMSWADEERDITAWLGNELQNEAFSKLYAQKGKVAALRNPDYDYVWSFMQTSDHFYYMATKWLSDGDVHSYFNPYDSAYDAFINYMNVLSDFEIELDKAVKAMGGTRAEEIPAPAVEKPETAETPAVQEPPAARNARKKVRSKPSAEALGDGKRPSGAVGERVPRSGRNAAAGTARKGAGAAAPKAESGSRTAKEVVEV